MRVRRDVRPRHEPREQGQRRRQVMPPLLVVVVAHVVVVVALERHESRSGGGREVASGWEVSPSPRSEEGKESLGHGPGEDTGEGRGDAALLVSAPRRVGVPL